MRVCRASDSSLLAYGTLCGGLLSDRYLGQPEPSVGALNTASLRKYKQMVDAWGGWGLFQQLLSTLRTVADRHDATIANVAVRYVLDRPAVAGVIVGARLGVAEHIAETARVFDPAGRRRGGHRGRAGAVARPLPHHRRLRREYRGC